MDAINLIDYMYKDEPIDLYFDSSKRFVVKVGNDMISFVDITGIGDVGMYFVDGEAFYAIISPNFVDIKKLDGITITYDELMTIINNTVEHGSISGLVMSILNIKEE